MHRFLRYSTIQLYNDYTMTLKRGLLKVIGTDMDRFATYDFLLTFHCNHGPISYHFQDKQRFQSKIAIFLNPRVFDEPLEFGIGA